MKPHKHAELIKQWAEGAEIQYRDQQNSVKWVDCAYPAWVEDYEYRIKPKEAERVYPQTKMTGAELESVWLQNYPHRAEEPSRTITDCRRACANAVLRHALDAGQVVTREEFDKVSAELKASQQAHGIYINFKNYQYN